MYYDKWSWLTVAELFIADVMLQLCRYVYEIMQTFHVDASRRLVSLDIDYWLVSKLSRVFVSVIQHDGANGESLKVHVHEG